MGNAPTPAPLQEILYAMQERQRLYAELFNSPEPVADRPKFVPKPRSEIWSGLMVG